MKTVTVIVTIVSALILGMSGFAFAEPAEGKKLGIAGSEQQKVMKGWSAKKMIVDQPVYNEKDEKIGEVEDIIITPEKSISYAIIGVGGFLGLGEHYVAVPFNQLKFENDKFLLKGASKEELKRIPEFKYTKK